MNFRNQKRLTKKTPADGRRRFLQAVCAAGLGAVATGLTAGAFSALFPNRAAADAPGGLPPIDLCAPEIFSTATFAMG